MALSFHVMANIWVGSKASLRGTPPAGFAVEMHGLLDRVFEVAALNVQRDALGGSLEERDRIDAALQQHELHQGKGRDAAMLELSTAIGRTVANLLTDQNNSRPAPFKVIHRDTPCWWLDFTVDSP